MQVVVFIHRPSSAIQISRISDFERLTLAHPKERCFFRKTRQGPQMWLFCHYNYHLGKLRLDSHGNPHQSLKRWLGRETGSKLSDFVHQEINFPNKSWAPIEAGWAASINFCGCPGFSLAQILAPGKSLFSNLQMDKSVSKHRSHYSAYAQLRKGKTMLKSIFRYHTCP